MERRLCRTCSRFKPRLKKVSSSAKEKEITQNKIMNPKVLFSVIAAVALAAIGSGTGRAQDIDTMRPVVVKTVPQAGSKEVAPGVMEVRVTFSKEMADKSWSWSTAWQSSGPEFIGSPKYEDGGRTCVVKVKLEPDKTYGWWLNSDRFHGFQDTGGRAAVPYLLVFKTKS
jgi:hypothetical protein